MMKKNVFVMIIAVLLSVGGTITAQTKKTAPKLNNAVLKKLGMEGQSFTKENNAQWKLKNGMTVYSTFPYGKKICGFVGPTPLFILVDDQQKIVSVAMAKNQETPEYLPMVKPLLKAWNGKTLKEARTFKPDVVSGATITSNAIIENMKAAADKLSK